MINKVKRLLKVKQNSQDNLLFVNRDFIIAYNENMTSTVLRPTWNPNYASEIISLPEDQESNRLFRIVLSNLPSLLTRLIG